MRPHRGSCRGRPSGRRREDPRAGAHGPGGADRRGAGAGRRRARPRRAGAMSAAAPGPGRAPRIVYVTSSRGVGGAEELIAALLAGGLARGWEQTVLNPFADAASVALA